MNGLVLVHAVVVAGDGAGANVHTLANHGIAEIGKMVGLGALSQLRLLGLDEIADVRPLADIAPGTQVRVRANLRAVADDGALP